MSPRKVRLVADAVKNKNVQVADVKLSFMPKKAARTIRTLIRSAVANAVNNQGIQADNLFVKTIEVNQGPTLKRWRARARGAAFPINKRTSNVSVALEERTSTPKKQSKTSDKKEVKETPKKTAPKKTIKKTTKKVEKENNSKESK